MCPAVAPSGVCLYLPKRHLLPLLRIRLTSHLSHPCPLIPTTFIHRASFFRSPYLASFFIYFFFVISFFLFFRNFSLFIFFSFFIFLFLFLYVHLFSFFFIFPFVFSFSLLFHLAFFFPSLLLSCFLLIMPLFPTVPSI